MLHLQLLLRTAHAVACIACLQCLGAAKAKIQARSEAFTSCLDELTFVQHHIVAPGGILLLLLLLGCARGCRFQVERDPETLAATLYGASKLLSYDARQHAS